ncbi:Cellular repressor of E1A-stimulated genes 1 [Nesidiocoris tenuis]|uniref:Cellular repressor of E1A-stimulated genes 1 n=1 Tax=Nesidiocoris tenuis TaxID=355587 RepID=A0ABN7AV33_9HEMI|nr:Cellular repressor of E1A-stimulated genes 1 [Nesidiocoris tenuis]
MKSGLLVIVALATVYDLVAPAAGELYLLDIIGSRRYAPQYRDMEPYEPRFNGNVERLNPPQPHTSTPPPPPIDEIARYARYIVHYTDWTTVGHISHQERTNWFPSARVFSMADGPMGQSTGTPYVYASFHDPTPRDLKTDPRCSMTMSLAQTDYCKNRNLDPEDPRCSQVILTGYFVILQNNTEEWRFAQNAMFGRHPEMKLWPESHHFFFAKLQIHTIQLVDNIGGSKYPDVNEYFNTQPPMVPPQFLKRRSPNAVQQESPVDDLINVNLVL